MVLITDGPGAGQYRRIVTWGATGDIDTDPCWWRLDRPFGGSFEKADLAQMQIVVTFFQGESIFTDNRFEDTVSHTIIAGIWVAFFQECQQ